MASNETRIQNFFREVTIDFKTLATVLLSLLPKEVKLRICIDRTEWNFGKCEVNILTILIGYRNFQVPLEKLIFLGQSEVYKEAGELAYSFFGLPNLTSQIYPLTNHYGDTIANDVEQVADLKSEPEGVSAVVYAQADGAMLLTDKGYKRGQTGLLEAAHVTSVIKTPYHTGMQRFS